MLQVNITLIANERNEPKLLCYSAVQILKCVNLDRFWNRKKNTRTRYVNYVNSSTDEECDLI